MGRQQPQQPGNRTGSPTGAASQTPGIDAPGPKAGAPTWLWGRLCPLWEQIWRPHLGPSVPPPPGPNPHSANVASCPLPGSADLERGQWYTVVGVVRGLPAPVGSDQRPQSAWPLSPSGLALLGTLGVLQTPAQASLQPNFQEDKFLGRWFTSGLASNSSWFLEKKKVLSMCKSLVAPAPDGGFNLTSTFLRKDQCVTRTLMLRPAGPPGCYSYTSPHGGSNLEVSVVETDYKNYALLHTESGPSPGPAFRMATLYSRSQAPGAAVREKFTAFAKARGFTEDGIVFLPRNEKCLEEHE
uniref:Prostaglandin-H2 D-isomerase n=2 Tax=Sus scrofa TaxID=9823 RepID=A0A4X1SE23_PIG